MQVYYEKDADLSIIQQMKVVVVGYVSWVDGQGPMFAADLVVAQRIRLYDANRPPHPGDADLMLATIAQHWLEHAVHQD